MQSGQRSAFLAMRLLDRRNTAQKLFLAITFDMLEWIGYGAALLPRDILIMASIIRIINRAYKDKKDNMSVKELLLMLAPSLASLAGYGIFTFYSGVYEKDMSLYIWNAHKEYILLKTMYQVLSFLSILAAIVVYQYLKEISSHVRIRLPLPSGLTGRLNYGTRRKIPTDECQGTNDNYKR